MNGILNTNGAGVDAWGHLGGFLSGLSLTYLLMPESLGTLRRFRVTSGLFLLGLFGALAVLLFLRRIPSCDNDPLNHCSRICDT